MNIKLKYHSTKENIFGNNRSGESAFSLRFLFIKEEIYELS